MAANEMGFGRSPLRFRHIYAESAKKDKWYENVPTSKHAHDGRFIAVNTRLMAVAMESTGGGSFIVLPLSQTGRLSGMNHPRVCGHAGPILDLAWHPYDDSLITSASEDTTVKLWRVDLNDGLTADLTNSEIELRGHRRRAMYIDWHPSARDILMSAGYDHQIIVWNVERQNPFQTLTCHNQPIQSIAWHPEGRLIASTSKDKTLRVMDPRSGGVVMSGPCCHMGPKASKALFLDENHIFTVGSGRHSDREFCVWNLENGLTSPSQRLTIDQSSGIILPYYDPDCKVVYLMGKGDGNFRYYEYMDQKVHYLNQHISSVPQRGVGTMPKHGVMKDKCEIFRFYKLHVTANVIEPLSMIAPRRGHFRDDLYPPTASQIPALSAEQWCVHGLNRGAVLMNQMDGGLINPPAPATGGVSVTQPRPAVPASLRNIGHLAADGDKQASVAQQQQQQKQKQQTTASQPQKILPPAAQKPAFGSQPHQNLQAAAQKQTFGPQPQPTLSTQPQQVFESPSQPNFAQQQQQQPMNLQPPTAGQRSLSLSPQPPALGSQAPGPVGPSPQNGHHQMQLSKSPQPQRSAQRCRISAAERRAGGRFSTDLGTLPSQAELQGVPRRASMSGSSELGESSMEPVERLELMKSPSEADHVPSFKSLVRAFEQPATPSESPGPAFSRTQRRAQSMRERPRRPITMDLGSLGSGSEEGESEKTRPRYIRRPESLQSPEEQRKSIQLALQHRSAQAPSTSSKFIEIKPRLIAIPESYEELREAFLQQQTEIRNLRFELERRDRDLARLREQLVAKGKMAMKMGPMSGDSSFC